MAPAASTGRARWIDASKGVLVALVVLHHVCTAVAESGAQLPVLGALDAAAASMRMPALMILSGLFAKRAVGLGARSLWRNRVGTLVYLTSVWAAIAMAAGAVGALGLHGSMLESMERFGERMADGVQPLWFLLALAVFFGYARIVRRLTVWMQLLSTLAVTAVVVLSPGMPGLVVHLGLLPFFFVGLHWSAGILWVAQSLRLDKIGTGLVGRVCAWAGRRTLAVLVVHVVLLPLVIRVVPPNIIGVLTGTAVLVTGSLLVRVVLGRVPGLFELPSALR